MAEPRLVMVNTALPAPSQVLLMVITGAAFAAIAGAAFTVWASIVEESNKIVQRERIFFIFSYRVGEFVSAINIFITNAIKYLENFVDFSASSETER